MTLSAPRQAMLVTMPWATPTHPSLALGLLSAILEQAGLPCVCLYGNLLLPRSQRPTVYGLADPGYYDDRSAGLAFVPHLYPQVSAEHIANTVAERHLRIISREGHIELSPEVREWKRGGALRDALIAQTLEDIELAGICLSRCMTQIAAADPDIIGFSLTFETQLAASLALAREIKARWPDKKIVFGGAACAQMQGISTLRFFPYIDAVCLGEGDAIVAPLFKGLRGAGSLADISGIAYRTDDRVEVTSHAEPMADLDWLPLPDYGPYLSQKAASEWADTKSILLFETSRGCWWGAKHLCSFCGLNAEALVYRSKSPQRVLDELAGFRHKWPIGDGLQAVDNIFDTRYFAELMPKLIEQQKQGRVSMFFEIKSNLKLWQLFQLSLAGMTALQPGIESFSDHILKLMDKGATALQQITFIKWAQQVGINPAYNILMRNPGETVEDYREMTELLPYLRHFQPPNGVANVQLERFSPYFLRPEEFGIRNIRPKPHYREMFPDPRVELNDLVYQFDYDHDALDAPPLLAARRAFLEAIAQWQARYEPHLLVCFAIGEDVLIIDKRGGEARRERLQGRDAKLYQYLDRHRTFAALCAHFPGDDAGLRETLLRWDAAKIIYPDRRKDAYLALAIRVYQSMDELMAHYRAELMQAETRQAPSQAADRALRSRLPVLKSI